MVRGWVVARRPRQMFAIIAEFNGAAGAPSGQPDQAWSAKYRARKAATGLLQCCLERTTT